MKLALGAVLAAATIAAAGQAAAQAPAATPAAPATKSKSDPNRMVCKSIPVTGTRFTKSICRTRGDWDDQGARNKQELMDQQARGQLQRERG